MSAIRDHLAESKAKVLAGPGSDFCAAPTAMLFPPEPEVLVDTRQVGMTRQTQNLGRHLHLLATQWYFGGATESGAEALNTLEAWAEADAYSSFRSQFGQGSAAYWPAYSGMAATLNALFLLDNHPELTDERRDRILDWAGRVLERTHILTQLPRGQAGGMNDTEQRRNNHNARRALILLYYGIHTENEDLISKSLADIQRSFDAIDAENVPLDANRGDWALNYTNFALDSMVHHTGFMAILDPTYPDFRSDLMPKLDGAMAFLFEEVQEQDRVHRYARANLGRPQSRYNGEQDIWFTRNVPEGIMWAWVDSDIAQMLPAGQIAFDKISDSLRLSLKLAKTIDTGGNVSCWFPD